MPWHVTVTIVDGCRGPNALVESDYGQSGYPGNFEVITVPENFPNDSYQHLLSNQRGNGSALVSWPDNYRL
jgi:hypothetical protein